MFPLLNEVHCREALVLLKLPFVRCYLLSPHATTDLRALTSKAQRRNSVCFTTQRVLTGFSAFEIETTSNWVFTPTYSQGHIIVGCGVQELQIHSRPRFCSWNREGCSMRRFVFNSTTGHMLSVSYQTAAGFIDAASFSTVGSSLAFTALLNLSALQTALDADLEPIFLRRAIIFSFIYSERRTCSRASTCDNQTSLADRDCFSFISMMEGANCFYSGTGILQKVANRSRRTDTLQMNVQCIVMRSGNTARISELWKWGILKSFHDVRVHPTRLEMPQKEMCTYAAKAWTLCGHEEHQSAGHAIAEPAMVQDGAMVSRQQEVSGLLSFGASSRIPSKEQMAFQNPLLSDFASTRRTPEQQFLSHARPLVGLHVFEREDNDCVKLPYGPGSLSPSPVHNNPITANRIAVHPNAVPATQSTYVSKRDEMMLERVKRNRQSAARSNEKRRQICIVLHEKLKKHTVRIKALEERKKQLLGENELLRELTKALL